MTTELIPYSETVSLPITVEQAKQQWDEYQRLTQQLLNDTDYQKIGGKLFKKKSAWRKYARAFNIADHVTYEHIERAEDGFPLWARIRVEASHANGRKVEADHECHISERCCSAARGEQCPMKTWRNHSCCPTNCSGRRHWSHPGDLPATALTRAKNRAIADLIGAGEVSAEEITEDDLGSAEPAQPQPNGLPPSSRATRGSGGNVSAFWTEARKLIKDKDAMFLKVQALTGNAGVGGKSQAELDALLKELQRSIPGGTCKHEHTAYDVKEDVARLVCSDCGTFLEEEPEEEGEPA